MHISTIKLFALSPDNIELFLSFYATSSQNIKLKYAWSNPFALPYTIRLLAQPRLCTRRSLSLSNKSILHKFHFVVKEAYCFSSLLHSGVYISRSNSFISETCNNTPELLFHEDCFTTINNALFLCDHQAPNYYHAWFWIASKILLYNELTGQKINLIVDDFPNNFVAQIFEILGIDLSLVINIRNKGPIKVKELHVINTDFIRGYVSLVDGVRLIRSKLHNIYEQFSNLPPQGRILLIQRKTSNNNSANRDIANIQDVAEYLKSRYNNNFIISCMEDLSVLEQIKLFRSTKIVIAMHGAALANIVHMLPGASLIEVLPKDINNSLYKELSEACDINHFKCTSYGTSMTSSFHSKTSIKLEALSDILDKIDSL